MLPLLPIIKTALNRLQPPPKPAVPYPTAPPPGSQTFSFNRQNTALYLLSILSLFLFYFFNFSHFFCGPGDFFVGGFTSILTEDRTEMKKSKVKQKLGTKQ